MKKEKIVCYCSNVSETTIIEAIRNGASTLEEIRIATSACTLGNCKESSPTKKCCSSEILALINKYSKK